MSEEDSKLEGGADETPIKKPILYNLNISPPVRSVKIVAQLIGLELELR